MQIFLGEIYINVYFFSIFVANEILKPFYTKRDLVTYYWFISLLISMFVIEIGPLCWWNVCFWISISPNFIIFSIFIYYFKEFYIFLIYNVPLFSVKSAFWNTFTALFLIIKVIKQQESRALMFKIAVLPRFIDIINKLWHLLQSFGWNLKL